MIGTTSRRSSVSPPAEISENFTKRRIPIPTSTPGTLLLGSDDTSDLAANHGSYFLVFNAILNFDNLNAGRKLDEKQSLKAEAAEDAEYTERGIRGLFSLR